MNLDEMRRLGMRPRRTAFLVLMEWPDPFVASPWWDAATGVRERQRLREEPTLFDALAPTTPGAKVPVPA